MINEIVKEYLDEAGVVELNPVWDSSHMNEIVGWHLQVTNKGIKEVMEKLRTIFIKNHLGYYLSECNHDERQKTFIIYLNH